MNNNNIRQLSTQTPNTNVFKLCGVVSEIKHANEWKENSPSCVHSMSFMQRTQETRRGTQFIVNVTKAHIRLTHDTDPFLQRHSIYILIHSWTVNAVKAESKAILIQKTDSIMLMKRKTAPSSLTLLVGMCERFVLLLRAQRTALPVSS
jgi:hypothetical protein